MVNVGSQSMELKQLHLHNDLRIAAVPRNDSAHGDHWDGGLSSLSLYT